MSSLLTAGPETAVETFLHLKDFGGFGLFFTTLFQSLASHRVRMSSIVFFVLSHVPCFAVLFRFAVPRVLEKPLLWLHCEVNQGAFSSAAP